MSIVIEARDVWKIYRMGKIDVPALRGVDLTIHQGEFLSIIGSSGCGKSTLLNLLGGLDRPTKGSIVLDGTDLVIASQSQVVAIRRHKIGFVFQAFHLIPTMTAIENVALPLRYARVPRKKQKELATRALSKMGLSERMHHRPIEMSGGEQQRVAVARAIVHEPMVVLADEPTGEIDSATSQMLIDLLRNLNSQRGITFVIVTHDLELAQATDRIISLKDGTILADRPGNASVHQA